MGFEDDNKNPHATVSAVSGSTSNYKAWNPDEKSPDFNRFQGGALFLQVNSRYM
jgi:hypothetical protein